MEHAWNAVAAQTGEWEKDCQHPVLLAAFAQRFAALNRHDDAIKMWKRYMETSADYLAYTHLADVYKAQGKMDLWQSTLGEYLRQKDQGLSHAKVRVTIAKEFMSKKDFKAAKPYADAAAATGAAWAMLCASECYEGLQEWGKSEQLVRYVSERYPEARRYWFNWCTRTGKGDIEAAKRLAGPALVLGDDMPAKQDPKPEDFLGKWVGRWDGTIHRQFTITRDPNTKELFGLYEFEERRGQPLRVQRFRARLEKNALILGSDLEITLSAKDADKAKALGKFKNPRTAELTREPVKKDGK